MRRIFGIVSRGGAVGERVREQVSWCARRTEIVAPEGRIRDPEPGDSWFG
jgi:hypothetical protein